MARLRLKADTSALTVLPMLANESLYVGVDIGKANHIAGFTSNTLLARHGQFEGCPSLKFENSREGFRQLVDRIRAYVPLGQAYVLMEKTGHYHRPLEEYLLEAGISVYVMHIQRRQEGLLKSDKRDALRLSNHIYGQLEKGVQAPEKTQLVRRALPPTEAAALLKTLMGHRYELSHESTKRRNQLMAIADQLFPEVTTVFKDPNGETALKVRAAFPTAHAVATASLDALCAAKGPYQPSRQKMATLQELAVQSVGIKDSGRTRSLVFEQAQLIRELQLIREHMDQIDAETDRIVSTSREGHILMSLPGIGLVSAASIMAAVGNINNFPSAASLKAYFGWAPRISQTGISRNSAVLGRQGERTMKEVLYMSAVRAAQDSSEFNGIYKRLVARKCDYDESRGDYVGKRKVIARIAGQICRMIYAFLKADADLLANMPFGQEPPEPMLFDPAIHQAHIAGGYKPMKPDTLSPAIIQLPQR